MVFCNHYSNCQLLLTPVIVILRLYLTLSISSSCTLVLIDSNFRCSNYLDMSTVSIYYNLYVTRLRQSLILRRPKQENKNKLNQFIGCIVNYYRNMWFRRNELLARIHGLASHQARSSLNGTHPINRPLIKSGKSLELRYKYFSVIQTSISPFIFILMHQIISWGQSSCRIKIL
jgi:hypothetical protein